MASVWIDGHAKGTFNQYAPSMSFKVRQVVPSPRAWRPHDHDPRRSAARARPTGTDTQVAVDAIEAGGKVDLDPGRCAWPGARRRTPTRPGGDVAVSDLAGTAATFAFYGTGVEWHTVLGPHQGRAKIYVDGALLKTVDNYAKPRPTADRTITGLALGVHELRIVVLGEARPAARGTQSSIDAFTVIP